MEILKATNPIYPLLGMFASIATLVFGLVCAKMDNILYFYAGIYVLYLCYGYYRACIAVVPMLALMITLFCGLTYLTGSDTQFIIYALNRSFAVCFATIAGLSTPTSSFIRNLRQIKVPKMVTLGMLIAINFFPLFVKEMRQIRSAMKTRGAGSIFNLKVFYRAFLIPLVVRIVHISDTLSLSVETRGFTMDNTQTTVFEPKNIAPKDILFVIIFVAMMAGVCLI